MYGERNMECYIPHCQWELSVWLRKLKQGLCINLEGLDEEEDGSEFQEGGHMCSLIADSC